MSQSTLLSSAALTMEPTSISPVNLQRIFFSPHPDDVAYSAFGTASRPPPRCCAHDDHVDEVISTKVMHQHLSSHKPMSIRRQHFSPLPSPALSSCSRLSNDDTLLGGSTTSIDTPISSSSSIFADSRRNSAHSSASSSSSSATSVDSAEGQQNALIVTIFSKSRCANGEIGERLQRNVDETTVLRTEEDEAFARSIGCDLLQLGFPDSSARDEPSRRPDLAEAAIKSAPGSRIEDVDHYIYASVRQALEPIVWMAVRAGAKIHLPLGVGCHVDHWMVRVAVLSLLEEINEKLVMDPSTVANAHYLAGGFEPLHERLVFYEDLPYADAQTNKHIEALARAVLPHGAKARLVAMTEADWCRKRRGILTYASQMKPTILPSLYNHATRLAQLGKLIDPEWNDSVSRPLLAAERIWVIDAELRRLALEQRQRDQDQQSQQLLA